MSGSAVDVLRRQRLRDTDDHAADNGADGAVEAAERRGGEREHEDRLHRRGLQPELRDREHAGQRAERGGEAPPEHQHATDRVPPKARVDSEFEATARIASPTFVCWKSR